MRAVEPLRAGGSGVAACTEQLSCTSLYEARRAVVDVQGQVVERVDAVEAGRQQHGPVHERRVNGRRRPGSRSSRMYSSTASRVSRRAPANSRKTRLANGCEFLSAVLNARWGGRARTLHSGCGRERRPRRRAFHAFARDSYEQRCAPPTPSSPHERERKSVPRVNSTVADLSSRANRRGGLSES